MSPPGQMIYLFIMSIMPTVPGAWLTFTEGVLYEAYDKPVRLFGLSVTDDQQLAGFIMKIIGGAFLWVVIATMFFRWAKQEEAAAAQSAPRPSPDLGSSVERARSARVGSAVAD